MEVSRPVGERFHQKKTLYGQAVPSSIRPQQFAQPAGRPSEKRTLSEAARCFAGVQTNKKGRSAGLQPLFCSASSNRARSGSVGELRGEHVLVVALIETTGAEAVHTTAERVVVLDRVTPVAEIEAQLVDRQSEADVPVGQRILAIAEGKALEHAAVDDTRGAVGTLRIAAELTTNRPLRVGTNTHTFGSS